MYEIGGKQIPATLAELVEPKRSALLLWDMEYAIAPNAFNYKDILINLKTLSSAARQAGYRSFIRCKLRLIYSKRRRPYGCACV
jgi:hypothetical protein